MQEVYNVNYINENQTAVALGYFDGVHIAHKKLINEMSEYADKNMLKKAIFTFLKSVKLNHKGKDILTKRQKVDEIYKLGVDLFYCPDFSEFQGLTPKEFVETILIKSMNAKAVFCGENFFFGKNRSGNIEVLEKLCKENGIYFKLAKTVEFENEIVSSSLIRESLEKGDMKKVRNLLGKYYSIDFEVRHGKKLGRTIGTPTINQIYPKTMCMPKQGVYTTAVYINDKKYPAATGISKRPTVSGDDITCETYILGFDGDLYGKNIKLEFYEFILETKKYDSLDDLANMIKSVAQKSKEYIDNNL